MRKSSLTRRHGGSSSVLPTPIGNVATFFTGGGPGDFLVYSDNFGLTQSSLQSTMTGAGHTWTYDSSVIGFTFDLSTLQGFDGVFVALPPAVPDLTALTNYVNGGGNVYLAGGTGVGGPVSEAAAWNPFLNAFGLQFASDYNGIGGNIGISSSHPTMAGVSQLFQDNGNSVSLTGSTPDAQIIASFDGEGLYAVYEAQPAPVPEPASLCLLGTGLIGLGRRAWRRRQQS